MSGGYLLAEPPTYAETLAAAGGDPHMANALAYLVNTILADDRAKAAADEGTFVEYLEEELDLLMTQANERWLRFVTDASDLLMDGRIGELIPLDVLHARLVAAAEGGRR